jgi:hypothetical protein
MPCRAFWRRPRSPSSPRSWRPPRWPPSSAWPASCPWWPRTSAGCPRSSMPRWAPSCPRRPGGPGPGHRGDPRAPRPPRGRSSGPPARGGHWSNDRLVERHLEIYRGLVAGPVERRARTPFHFLRQDPAHDPSFRRPARPGPTPRPGPRRFERGAGERGPRWPPGSTGFRRGSPRCSTWGSLLWLFRAFIFSGDMLFGMDTMTLGYQARALLRRSAPDHGLPPLEPPHPRRHALSRVAGREGTPSTRSRWPSSTWWNPTGPWAGSS